MRAPIVSHFKAFGCRCFILKKGRLDKFESRSSDGIFWVMLVILEHFVCSTMILTYSSRLVRLPSMRHNHAIRLSLSVQVTTKLARRSLSELPATHVPSTSTTTATVQDGQSLTSPTIQ
jgi:hypothetical protein